MREIEDRLGDLALSAPPLEEVFKATSVQYQELAALIGKELALAKKKGYLDDVDFLTSLVGSCSRACAGAGIAYQKVRT